MVRCNHYYPFKLIVIKRVTQLYCKHNFIKNLVLKLFQTGSCINICFVEQVKCMKELIPILKSSTKLKKYYLQMQFPFISKSPSGQTHLYPLGELTKQAIPAGADEHSW